MKAAIWMAALSIAAWLASLAVLDAGSGQAVFFGMLAPLAVACGSWVMSERTWKRDPQALTGRMMAAFAFKLVFFGGYVAAMLRIVGLRPVPFTVSFSCYFIALHFVEALLLRRLLASGPRA